MIRRGGIAIVDFSATDPSARVRPALIIQNDRDNLRLNKTIVVQITSVLKRVNEPTNLLVDQRHPDWSASGLRLPSLITCSNVASIRQVHVVHLLGTLSPATMTQVDRCLKAAFGIS